MALEGQYIIKPSTITAGDEYTGTEKMEDNMKVLILTILTLTVVMLSLSISMDKADKVLAPLAKSLAPGGRMVVVQSTGLDPGMEIIRQVWPDEDPFLTPRHTLITALRGTLNSDGDHFAFDGFSDDRSLFTYHMHALPEEIGSNIGTSTLLAAWNAAVYVAQIEDHRLTEVLHSGDYLEATWKVIHRHGGLWFQDESFVVVRNPEEGGGST